MAHVRNYFQVGPPMEGEFTITGGVISPDPALTPGAWIALEGAGSHTGVWQLDCDARLPDVPDMAFHGRIWLLEPPADFLHCCCEIAAWIKIHPKSDLLQETIGDYSRTTAGTSQGGPLGWQQLFSTDLMRYRRMLTEVRL